MQHDLSLPLYLLFSLVLVLSAVKLDLDFLLTVPQRLLHADVDLLVWTMMMWNLQLEDPQEIL